MFACLLFCVRTKTLEFSFCESLLDPCRTRDMNNFKSHTYKVKSICTSHLDNHPVTA